jgi:hypothetical protein
VVNEVNPTTEPLRVNGLSATPEAAYVAAAYDTHSASIYGLALRATRDPELAADITLRGGATCAPDPKAYLTTDGVHWSPIAHPPIVSGDGLADGPAGVLLIGQGTVWRLDP